MSVNQPIRLAGIALLLGTISVTGCKSETRVHQTDTLPPVTRSSESKAVIVDSDSSTTRTSDLTLVTTETDTGSRTTRTVPTMLSPPGANNSSMAFPTGDPATSVILVEKSLPSEIQAGQPFVFSVRVTNLTQTSLSNVVLTDTMSTGVNVTGSNPPADVLTSSGMIFKWSLGAFAPGEAKTIMVNAEVADAGPVEICGNVTWDQGLCVNSTAVRPRLEVTKTAPSEVLACDPIETKIVVMNNGSGSARNVRLIDTLPAGMTDASGKAELDWDIGTLAAGQSKEVTVSLKAGKSGTYTNTATARADGGLMGDSNSTTTVVKKPVLTITKTCSERAYIGMTANVTITVKNTGDGVAKDTVIEDTLPAGMTLVTAADGGTGSGDRIQWRLGTLEPGAERTVNAKVTSNSQTTLNNTAKAIAYCADAVTASGQVRFEGISAILLEVVDENDPNRIGENEEYTIVVTNQGSAPDTNIIVTATVEDAQQLVSGSGPTTGTVNGDKITFAPLAVLNSKGVATWKVVAKSLRAADVRFKVSMKSDQLGRTVDETEATTLYQ